jgi:hypothetical protein
MLLRPNTGISQAIVQALAVLQLFYRLSLFYSAHRGTQSTSPRGRNGRRPPSSLTVSPSPPLPLSLMCQSTSPRGRNARERSAFQLTVSTSILRTRHWMHDWNRVLEYRMHASSTASTPSTPGPTRARDELGHFDIPGPECVFARLVKCSLAQLAQLGRNRAGARSAQRRARPPARPLSPAFLLSLRHPLPVLAHPHLLGEKGDPTFSCHPRSAAAAAATVAVSCASA